MEVLVIVIRKEKKYRLESENCSKEQLGCLCKPYGEICTKLCRNNVSSARFLDTRAIYSYQLCF